MVLCGTSPTRTLVLRLRVFTEDNVYAAQPDHRPQICLTSSHIIQIKEGRGGGTRDQTRTPTVRQELEPLHQHDAP